jgi:hypothetical protein
VPSLQSRQVAELTAAQAAEQATISAAVTTAVISAWGVFDPYRVDATFPDLLRELIAIVASSRILSARSAARWYSLQRELSLPATERGPDGHLSRPAAFEVTPMELVDLGRLTTSITVTAPIRIKLDTAAGVPVPEAATAALVQTAGAAQKEALAGGRETVAGAGARDRLLLGWQRVLESARPCAFCAMLASRGPVYRTRSSGGQDPRGNVHRYHDHCACIVQPVYSTDTDLPSRSAKLGELWNDSTKGLSGREARIAFRQAVEGREAPKKTPARYTRTSNARTRAAK